MSMTNKCDLPGCNGACDYCAPLPENIGDVRLRCRALKARGFHSHAKSLLDNWYFEALK